MSITIGDLTGTQAITPAKQQSGDVILGDLAMDQWEDYKSRFLPLEKSFAARMMDDSPAKRNQVVSGAMANVQDAMAKGNEAMTKRATGAGINPNSGRVMGIGAEYAGTMGKSAAIGAVGADDSVTGGRWAGMTKSMRMGRGQASQSIAGLTSSAYLAEQAKALESQTDNYIKSSNYGMYGGLVGTAVGAGMYNFGGLQPPTVGSGVSAANMQPIPTGKIMGGGPYY